MPPTFPAETLREVTANNREMLYRCLEHAAGRSHDTQHVVEARLHEAGDERDRLAPTGALFVGIINAKTGTLDKLFAPLAELGITRWEGGGRPAGKVFWSCIGSGSSPTWTCRSSIP